MNKNLCDRFQMDCAGLEELKARTLCGVGLRLATSFSGLA